MTLWIHYSRHIGEASNNSAEIEALVDSTAEVRYSQRLDPDVPVFFFVDSKETINLATGRSKARPWCASRVQTIQNNLIHIGAARRTAVCWVPGHANIIGNDTADAVAKRGAAGFTGYGAITRDHPTRPDVPDSKGRAAAGPAPSVKYANVLARVKDWSELRRERKNKRKRKLEMKDFNSRQWSQEEPH